ncbi:MAG TPA: hypothetical protein VK776_26720 [Bryobacteraceae bacterium]|nr:hypothetical protein [Bryobacteraceae bacterium]
MRPAARILRLIAGVTVLLVLAAIAIILIPPYVQNLKLQRYVNDLIDDPATASLPPEVIRQRVLGRAAALSLPVHSQDVQVRQVHTAIRIDVLYVVHVDVATYTVDLHFRPAAGGS